MPVYTNATARPRQELAAVIREGRGVNLLNIWNQILPDFPVNKRTAHIIKARIANAQLMRILDDYLITAPGAKIERLTATLDDDSFTVAIRKREIQIPDEEEMEMSDYLSLETLFSQQGAESLELTTEFLTARAMQSTAIFGAATNSIVAYSLANLATIDFVGDVYASHERGLDKGEAYNAIICSGQIYKIVRRSSKLKDFVVSQLGKGYEVNASNLQLAFADIGIKKFLVGNSVYNTAADGATPVMSRVWGNSVVTLARVADDSATVSEDGIETIDGVGINAFWDSYTPEAGYMVDTYREENTESNIVRTKTSKAPYIANPNAADLIATQA